MKPLLAGLVSLLGFNINPMNKARDQIDRFKRTYPHHIQTYPGVHRQMGFAHAGDRRHRPIVFVHGSPGSKEAWYAFLLDPELTSKFHLLAVDRPGYGGSGRETERSLTRQAQDVWEVLRFNRSGQSPIFVGHSYGGAVIAKVAVLHPQEVGALVFVASSVDPALEETKLIQWIGDLWGVRALIPNDLRVCNQEILGLKDELTRMVPQWAGVSARVAIVHGDQDDLVPVANTDFIAARTNVHHRQILRGMNHFIPWEMPRSIKTAVFQMAHVDRPAFRASPR